MTEQPDDERSSPHDLGDASFEADGRSGDPASEPGADGRARFGRLGGWITLLATLLVAAFVIPQWFDSESSDEPTAVPGSVNTSPASANECPATDGLLAEPPAGWVPGPTDALLTGAAPSRIVVCAYSGVGQPDVTQVLARSTAVVNAREMALDLSRVPMVVADVPPCTEEFRDTDRDQFLVAVTHPGGEVVWLNARGNHCSHSIGNGAFVTDDSQWERLTITARTGVWPTGTLPPTGAPSSPADATPECPDVGFVAGIGEEGANPRTVPVPEATAPGADAALARRDAPLAAAICGYSIHAMRPGATPDMPEPSLLGTIQVSNPEQLAADLHAASPWSGERGCTLIGGSIDRYLVALTYPDGVIWVGVENEPNHCLPASNGQFTADENLGEDVAQAFTSGVWRGDTPAIACPDITVGDLPPAARHVEVPAAPTVPGADGFLTSPDVPSSGYVCSYDVVGDDGVEPDAGATLTGTSLWLESPDTLSAALSLARPRSSGPLVCDTVTGPERRHLVHFTYPTGEIWVAIEESESGCARAWNGAFEADANLGSVVAEIEGVGIRRAVDWPGTAAEGFAVPCVNSYDAQGELAAPATTTAAARKAMDEAKLLVVAHPQELPMATYCTDGQAVQLLYVMDGTAGQAEAEQIKDEAGAWEGANPGAAEIRSVDPLPSIAAPVIRRIDTAPAALGVASVRYDRFTGVTVVTMTTEAAGGSLAARVAKVRELAEPGPTESWPMEVPIRFRTGQEVTVP